MYRRKRFGVYVRSESLHQAEIGHTAECRRRRSRNRSGKIKKKEKARPS